MCIFEYPDTNLASECMGTTCIKDIKGQCCRKSHDKFCCDIEKELKYETSFLRNYPKCPASPLSKGKTNSQSKMSCYTMII